MFAESDQTAAAVAVEVAEESSVVVVVEGNFEIVVAVETVLAAVGLEIGSEDY